MKTTITADTSGADVLAGYMAGFQATLSSKRYLDSATAFTYSTLKEEFGISMDAEAYAHKSLFHHVYEWGDSWHGRYSRVGGSHSRLWALVATGTGGNRTMTYVFLPSVVPVPVHPDLTTPGKKGRVVEEGVHVFSQKAAVLEYGIPVTIRPKLAKALAMPSGNPGTPFFRDKEYTRVPGEGGTMGMFDAFYITWWNTQAPAIFDDYIRPRLESDAASEAGLHSALAGRRREVKITIGTNVRAYEKGRRAAVAQGERNASKYLGRAAERKFGDDFYEYDD